MGGLGPRLPREEFKVTMTSQDFHFNYCNCDVTSNSLSGQLHELDFTIVTTAYTNSNRVNDFKAFHNTATVSYFRMCFILSILGVSPTA